MHHFTGRLKTPELVTNVNPWVCWKLSIPGSSSSRDSSSLESSSQILCSSITVWGSPVLYPGHKLPPWPRLMVSPISPRSLLSKNVPVHFLIWWNGWHRCCRRQQSRQTSWVLYKQLKHRYKAKGLWQSMQSWFSGGASSSIISERCRLHALSFHSWRKSFCVCRMSKYFKID